MNQILKVLDCRNELIMKDYSKVATELARISNAQNNSMNTIAREARRDSRMVKVLTVIAMAYVPAGVIAVRYPLSFLEPSMIRLKPSQSIFSSGLIRTSDQMLPTNSFHISKDIWIFILSSLGVTTITISMAFWWAQAGH